MDALLHQAVAPPFSQQNLFKTCFGKSPLFGRSGSRRCLGIVLVALLPRAFAWIFSKRRSFVLLLCSTTLVTVGTLSCFFFFFFFFGLELTPQTPITVHACRKGPRRMCIGSPGRRQRPNGRCRVRGRGGGCGRHGGIGRTQQDGRKSGSTFSIGQGMNQDMITTSRSRRRQEIGMLQGHAVVIVLTQQRCLWVNRRYGTTTQLLLLWLW